MQNGDGAATSSDDEIDVQDVATGIFHARYLGRTSMWWWSRHRMLEMQLAEVQSKCERLERQVAAMWDAPGMPGANAERDAFEAASQNL